MNPESTYVIKWEPPIMKTSGGVPEANAVVSLTWSWSLAT
jgi:hypothetical protein